MDGLIELQERLERADRAMGVLIDAPDNTLPERTRLHGKRDGIRLALSYLHDTLRIRETT